MNLTVPSFNPALLFEPVAVDATVEGGDLLRCGAVGSRGLIGEFLGVALMSFVPLVALTPLVRGFFMLVLLVWRGYLFAEASWFRVMRIAMKVSIAWSWPTMVEAR